MDAYWVRRVGERTGKSAGEKGRRDRLARNGEGKEEENKGKRKGRAAITDRGERKKDRQGTRKGGKGRETRGGRGGRKYYRTTLGIGRE